MKSGVARRVLLLVDRRALAAQAVRAFDLVVADECHRGYTAAEQSVWRNTLERVRVERVRAERAATATQSKRRREIAGPNSKKIAPRQENT